VRRRRPVFGLGAFDALDAANPSVFAYLRTHEDDVVLCVNNLSRFAQPVQLDLRRFAGMTPVEMLGRVHFPPIGELPYLLTLAPHGFYWFSIENMP
jgi:maltose alpha-D-glucosyltransferase/alpha-amylase